MTSRFFIDERCGCIAVRDKSHPEYDSEYPGLSQHVPDVIFFASGTYVNNSWEISDRTRDKALQVLEHLNKLIESHPK